MLPKIEVYKGFEIFYDTSTEKFVARELLERGLVDEDIARVDSQAEARKQIDKHLKRKKNFPGVKYGTSLMVVCSTKKKLIGKIKRDMHNIRGPYRAGLNINPCKKKTCKKNIK